MRKRSDLLLGVKRPDPYVYTWNEVQPAGDVNRFWYCGASNLDGSFLIVGSYYSGAGTGRLYISTDDGTSWVETRPVGDVDRYWDCVAVNDDASILLAGTGQYAVGMLYISTDYGSTWNEVHPDPVTYQNWYACCMDSDGSVMFASCNTDSNKSLYRSTNYGSSWTKELTTGKQPMNVRCSSDGSFGVACFFGGGLYTSINYGDDWAFRKGNWGWTGVSCDNIGKRVVAVSAPYGYSGGVWFSHDNGVSFSRKDRW